MSNQLKQVNSTNFTNRNSYTIFQARDSNTQYKTAT